MHVSRISAVLAVCLAVLGCVVPGSAFGRSRTPWGRLSLPESQAFAGLSGAVGAQPYGWPLRPFDRQHRVRGGFGDPRFGARQRNFHFGIDIQAQGGTPVYAVAPGTVFLAPDRVYVLRRKSPDGPSGFSYWHVLPAVPEYRYVHRHALLGWVNPAWGHLHFAELRDGSWVNPLRPQALTPYVDEGRPHVGAIVASGTVGHQVILGRRTDITVRAFLSPPQPVERPWQAARLAPTQIRWRLISHTRGASAWMTAVDFRRTLPANEMYASVYAPGTRPNGPNQPGTYVFYLARNWDAHGIPAGEYTLEVEATGPRGRTAATTTTLHFDQPTRDGSPPRPVAAR
jgi:hypothetical protein